MKIKKSKNFAEEIRRETMISIIVVTLLTLGISIAVFSSAMARQRVHELRNHQKIITEHYSENLNKVKEVLTSFILDDAVQSFSKQSTDSEGEKKNVHSLMQNFLDQDSNIRWMALVNEEGNEFLTNGNVGQNYETRRSECESILNNGKIAREGSSITGILDDKGSGEYRINLMMPVYSTILPNISNGYVFVSYQLQRKGNNTDTFQVYNGESNNKLFVDAGNLVLVSRIGKWNYSLVNKISLWFLSKNILITCILVFLSACLVLTTVLWKSGKVVSLHVRSIQNVTDRMIQISGESLKVPINTENLDPDAERMANGFNQMINEVNRLLKEVKHEQRERDVLKFNMLQSQIQPHFLYNTLDCIHWQAAIDGNTEVSSLVKSLANYYRLCLSNGNDIITLEQELEHIQEYLRIQNFRYDNLIDLEVLVPCELYMVKIPKLTLQPLVENSIYHGIRVKEGKRGKITVNAWRQERFVYICVSDNGKGMDAETVTKINQELSSGKDAVGYGIYNVNARIKIFFGQDSCISYRINNSGGIDAVIRLELKESDV